MPIVIAEFLTGSTPLPSLLSPLTLPTLLGLYGAGALLVRELTVIWRKGWPTVLALGCAYGIVEEGLDVKSWFNPHWAGIGLLGTYGRLFGVNWVWATELTIFHSVFSITIPVALASLLFPDSSGDRWLPGRKLPLVAGLFVLDVLFGFTFTPYSAPALQYLVALGMAVALVIVARGLPASLYTSDGPSRLKGAPLFAIGLASTTAFFLIFWVLPNLSIPPAVDVLLAAALSLSLGLFLRGTCLSGSQAFSLVCGALSFLIAISVLSLNFLQGPPFVGAALTLYLFFVRRRAKNVPLPAPGAN
jgi:hypothetical protein